MQLSALVDEFLIDGRARRLAPKTIAWYAGHLRYFLDWTAAEGLAGDLAALTLATARRYSRGLTDRTAHPGTFVNSAGARRGVYARVETDRPLAANMLIGYLPTLKRFSRWLAAKEQDYPGHAVMAGLKLPRGMEQEPAQAFT